MDISPDLLGGAYNLQSISTTLECGHPYVVIEGVAEPECLESRVFETRPMPAQILLD